MPSLSRQERSFIIHEHLLRVLANNVDSNVGDEATKHHEETMLGEGLACKAPCIVTDKTELADLGNEPRKNTLARARPDVNSLQRLNLPHGGRQLSWWDHGRCHGYG
jgi:hypothetical protein